MNNVVRIAAVSSGTAFAENAIQVGPPVIAQTTSGAVAGTSGDVRAFKGIPADRPVIVSIKAVGR